MRNLICLLAAICGLFVVAPTPAADKPFSTYTPQTGDRDLDAIQKLLAVTGSFDKAASVTGNDTTDLPVVAKQLYIGGGGNVKVDLTGAGMTGIVFTAVPTGTILHLSVKRVYLTGTTATSIVELY